MGTNSKTTHASYAVAPTAGGEPVVENSDDTAEEFEVLGAVTAFALGGVDPDDPWAQPIVDLPDGIEQRYALFVEAVADAQAEIAKLDDAAAAKLTAGLRAQCAIFLHDLTPEELEALAAAGGFKYGPLVGREPLEHWLDPSYPADAESKKKIQALAHDRYLALWAGDTVGGKTLSEWEQTHPAFAETPQMSLPPGFSPWHASAADIAGAQADFTSALAALDTTTGAHPDAVAALIAAENRLATAHNPALSNDLQHAVATARHQTDQALTHVQAHELAVAITAAEQAGQLTPSHAQVLNPQQMLKTLRATTSADERGELEKLAAARADQLAQLSDSAATLHQMLDASGGKLQALDSVDAISKAATFVDATHQLATATAVSASWNPVAPLVDHSALLTTCTTGVDSWAHQQQLAELRAFVTGIGLMSSEHVGAATKSQLVKSLFQHVSGVIPQATKPASPPPIAPPKGTFGAQHAQMLAALRHAQAGHAAAPKPVDPATVAAWDFGPGQPATLGGTYPKTLHTGPDGTTWLAKGEGGQRGGTVIHAESAASRALARAGLPAVPVYATKIGGKPVSVQPMLTGATEMSPSPSSWSQADVDAIVGLHVTSWALGNHDSHHSNVLRTKDGGLVPVDYGQSFKNYGHDQLAVDYRPSTTTVYHQLYDAHLAGRLPKGIHVNPGAAHAVIKRLEAVPDAEWRAMLHSAAHVGAAQSQVTWVAPMRARAAKQHGIAASAVSTAQIAEAFLDYSVERKKNLRRDFAKFFTGELGVASASALEYLGTS
ncbi:hypothetical protein [Amycolatopsis sp. NPDC059657]|uniref:hypothetical protein n=1 Tax=Amycolatopsis sp. NPDC059657 TaxID=3346899 RepID=UPI00366CBEDB